MRSFTPIMNLYGHVEPVTCLASSQSYSLIVSGSRDRTAIIWDLNRFTFVRQLGRGPKSELVHHGPISAIAINDSSGDIATCASSWLYLWTINGELLAKVDSFNIIIQQSMGFGTSVSSNMNQLHILSVCFSQFNDWDSDEVIITGTSDGSVALWSMRYYQSPEPRPKLAPASSSNQNNTNQDNEDTSSSAGAGRSIENQTTIKANGSDETTSSEQHEPTLSIEETKDIPDGASTRTTKPLGPTAIEGMSIDREASDQATTQQQDEMRRQHTGASSEPIAIRGQRQRTDTMNSEWVRLSASSASTTETIPVLRATPTSPTSDILTSSDFLASGESFGLSCEATSTTTTTAEPSSPQPAGLAQSQPISNTPPSLSPQDADRPTSSTPLLAKVHMSEGGDSLEQNSSSVSLVGPQRANAGRNLAATRNEVDEQLDGGIGQSMSGSSKANLFLTTPNDPSLLKFSKSDTSLVDSFVILGEAPGGGGAQLSPSMTSVDGSPNRARPQSSLGAHQQQHSPASESGQRARKRFVSVGGHNQQQNQQRAKDKLRNSTKLQPGYCWKRELYLRMALPRRQGKIGPAAVTSLTISKDHKTLYVGASPVGQQLDVI